MIYRVRAGLQSEDRHREVDPTPGRGSSIRFSARRNYALSATEWRRLRAEEQVKQCNDTAFGIRLSAPRQRQDDCVRARLVQGRRRSERGGIRTGRMINSFDFG